MNIGRMKLFLWVLALVLGGHAAFLVADFAAAPRLPRGLGIERSIGRCGVERPELAEPEHVAYADVRRTFHELNWTGELLRPPGGCGGPPPQAIESPAAVAELLSVLYVRVDLADGGRSVAYTRYEDAQLAAARGSTGRLLRVGERLAAPHDDVTVAAITAAGVRFAFDDPAREAELVPLPERDSLANLSDERVGRE